MTKVINKWNQLVLKIPYKNWEAVELLLYENQLYSFEIVDPRYEIDKSDLEAWLYYDKSIFNQEYEGITVKLYTEEENKHEFNNLLEDIQTKGLATWDLSIIDESDWENNWKDYYEVEEIGKRLAIVPSWEKYENSDNRLVINLNPGMAFGTGHHETTRLAMSYMEKYLQPNDRVLDIGTGSGILAITAGLLGAKIIVGTDIDQNSLDIATNNARINDIEAQFLESDLLKNVSGEYDLVVSNIVAEIIILMLPDLKEILSKGGVFIASGIINDKLQLFKDKIIEYGFDIVDMTSENEWNSLVIRRKDNV